MKVAEWGRRITSENKRPLTKRRGRKEGRWWKRRESHASGAQFPVAELRTGALFAARAVQMGSRKKGASVGTFTTLKRPRSILDTTVFFLLLCLRLPHSVPVTVSTSSSTSCQAISPERSMINISLLFSLILFYFLNLAKIKMVPSEKYVWK